jgi:hypothetical protein
MSDQLSSRRDGRDDMAALGERLVVEFAGVASAADVRECVLRCRDRLVGSGLRHGLVPATEAAVRVSLAAAVWPRCTG